MKKIFIINGPNLNFLGIRETGIYGNEKIDGIVINPGAYTHYSYAIHDAIKSISIPTVEVHLSDIHKREDFRKISVTAPACVLQIYGKGKEGYVEAVEYIMKSFENR